MPPFAEVFLLYISQSVGIGFSFLKYYNIFFKKRTVRMRKQRKTHASAMIEAAVILHE